MKIATIHQNPKSGIRSVIDINSNLDNIDLIINERDPQFSHVLISHTWFSGVKIAVRTYADITCAMHQDNCIRDLFELHPDLYNVFKDYIIDPKKRKKLMEERCNLE